MTETLETSNVIAPVPGSLKPVPAHTGPEHAGGEIAHSHVPTHYPPRTGWRVRILGAVIVIGLIALFVLRHISNAREAAPLEVELQRSANEPNAVDVIHVKAGVL